MSRYDVIQKERTGLRLRQAAAVAIPAILLVALLAIDAWSVSSPVLLPAIILTAIPVVSLVFHHVWKAVFPAYREWAIRSAHIAQEIARLRARVGTIFESYRERGKNEAFKKAYALVGKSVTQLEEALAVGMYRERREVFVTAFMRAGVAVRVTASIGSPYKCAAADNPARWAEHVYRLRCDEIRQYHNHPVHNGTTRPSPTDFRTSGSLRRLLGPHGPKLKSLIICWNALREWKVFEHDDDRRHWLCREFDVDMTQLPLRLLHSEAILSRVKLDHFRRLSTTDLIESLALGKPGALKARPDGTVLDGHHRIVVLRERGVSVDTLPREVVPHEMRE